MALGRCVSVTVSRGYYRLLLRLCAAPGGYADAAGPGVKSASLPYMQIYKGLLLGLPAHVSDAGYRGCNWTYKTYTHSRICSTAAAAQHAQQTAACIAGAACTAGAGGAAGWPAGAGRGRRLAWLCMAALGWLPSRSVRAHAQAGQHILAVLAPQLGGEGCWHPHAFRYSFPLAAGAAAADRVLHLAFGERQTRASVLAAWRRPAVTLAPVRPISQVAAAHNPISPPPPTHTHTRTHTHTHKPAASCGAPHQCRPRRPQRRAAGPGCRFGGRA